MATQILQPPHGSPAWFHATVSRAAMSETPSLELVQMSPSLAQELLNQNPGNRCVRQTKVAQYSSDMAGGNWTLNGEPIIVSRDGKLNDGQHRCLAVIDSNATVPVVLMFGIERETRLTVDQGGARTAGDFLGMEGVHNAAISAAVARMVIAHERNEGKGLSGSAFVSSADIRERVRSDPSLAEAATFGVSNVTYSRNFAAGSLIGFAYYVLTHIHHDEARAFLERVCRGDGLKVGSPAHTLREKLIAEGRSRDRKAAMILKAWNFHRRGMKVRPASLNGTLPFPALI
jgi:hypothetical protein